MSSRLYNYASASQYNAEANDIVYAKCKYSGNQLAPSTSLYL